LRHVVTGHVHALHILRRILLREAERSGQAKQSQQSFHDSFHTPFYGNYINPALTV
jgi:hypothetical protein